MANKKEEKTNVMRTLEQKKIPYTAYTYPHEDGVPVDGATVARRLGASNGMYVFVVPVEESLDLKKAAKAVGEKSIAMVHVSEINGLTGYVRGGCSPVGMKKLYPTVFHVSALDHDIIMVSAGKIGWQVALAPQALMDLVRGKAADIIVG